MPTMSAQSWLILLTSLVIAPLIRALWIDLRSQGLRVLVLEQSLEAHQKVQAIMHITIDRDIANQQTTMNALETMLHSINAQLGAIDAKVTLLLQPPPT